MRADRHVVMGTVGAALATPCVAALVGAATDSAIVRAYEEVLFDGGSTEHLIRRLMSLGNAGPPHSFAIAIGGHGHATVVVGGTATAHFREGAELRHTSADSTPWTTVEVAADDHVTLALEDDDNPTGQWFTTGVVAAGRLQVGRLRPTGRPAGTGPTGANLDVDFGNLVRSAAEHGADGAGGAPTVELAVPPVVRSADTAAYVAPAGAPGPGRLVLSDGRALALDTPIVVGRRPPADPIAGQPPQLVAVDDTMLSRHHATFRVLDGRLIVTDEHSTNGTTLLVPGSDGVRCAPGEHVDVPAGATVDLGGVLAATYERPTSC
jgi:hypothetical protein